MRKVSLAIVSIFLLIFLNGCSASVEIGEGEHFPEDEILYQVSTLSALLDGAYDGQVLISNLKKHGDLGIGTFSGLDGEMIVLDDRVFRASYDGSVEEVDDLEMTPFAAITCFDVDEELDGQQFKNYEELKEKLDGMVENKNLFYAFKISGDFSYVKVRSVPPQNKPYPPLSEVTKNQPVFEYEDLKGHLVGFWCPEYVEGLNVPGYHLHFISEDLTKGGHLLEIQLENSSIMVDQTPSFQMKLPENDSFGKLDLNRDQKKEIERVEK